MKKLHKAIISAAAAICYILAQLPFAAPKVSAASAELCAIYVSCGELSPSFSPEVTNYTLSVSDVSSLMIQPVAKDQEASVTINGAAYQAGSYYHVNLEAETSSIVIAVKSANNLLKRYTITVVNKSGLDLPGLSYLAVDCAELSPSFNTNTFEYFATVENSVSCATITAIALENSQTITVNDYPVTSGEGFTLPLTVGENTAEVTVCNAGGGSKTYKITITRLPQSQTVGLGRLTVSPGALCPSFNTDTLNYYLNVENSVSSVTITPTVLSGSQTVTVNGKKVESGEGFILQLSAGDNTAVITVSSSGGSKTYVVAVTREASSISLDSLVLSAGSLSPAFNPNVYSYYASVENNVSRLYISASPSDVYATVKVNGSTSGYASLNVGYNTVTVTVTADDGTEKSYTITVFRKFATEITVTSPDSSGAYCATVPDFVSMLGDSDTVTFSLGDNTIIIPASTLKIYKTGGGLTVSSKDLAQADLNRAFAAADSNITIAGGVDISLSGGASDSCYINAAVTAKLKSGVKSILKEGVPEVYYFNSDSGTLVKTDAGFDMSAGTVTFNAPFSGPYVFAASLADQNVSYTVVADSKYTQNGSSRTFGVKIVRASDSVRLGDPRLLVITTLSNGSQTASMFTLTGDNCDLTVSVSGQAVKSSVYLINGFFDGKEIPTSYALVQFVGG